MFDLSRHPSHAGYRSYPNRDADAVREAKDDFWKAWIDTIDMTNNWDVNPFLKTGSTGRGTARVAAIKAMHDGAPVTLTSNEEKGLGFRTTFFLPPGRGPVLMTQYPSHRFAYAERSLSISRD